MLNLELLNWPESGLLPVIAQDATSGRVLTLAWVNREALLQTFRTRRATYFSRSRNQLWQKGETSGHYQHIVDVRFDCDVDAVLYVVEAAGPACHTGRVSCFFHQPEGKSLKVTDDTWPKTDILTRLAMRIDERRQANSATSYVKSLLEQPTKATHKVEEEAAELLAAVAQESPERVAHEAADLLFHVLVVTATRGVTWQQIAAVLESRFGISGYQEKAQRQAKNS